MKEYENNLIYVIIATLITFSLIVNVPFFLYQRDLWDGVIISNAFNLNESDIYNNWFVEAGLILTPYFYDAIFALQTRYYFVVILSVMFVCHYASAYFLFRIVSEIYKFRVVASVAVFTFFVFSPVWSIYSSSVFLMHSVTLLLSVYVTYKVALNGYDKTYKHQYVSLICLQQASLPVLILSLLAIDLIRNGWRDKLNGYLRYVLILSVGFLLTRYIFPAHGLYEGYNKINIVNLLNINNYKVFIDFFWVVYPVLPLLILVLFFHGGARAEAAIMIALVALSTLPFILVNKPPYPSHFFGIQGWEQRQAITIVPLVGVFMGYMLNLVINSFRLKLLTRVLIAASFINVSMIYIDATVYKIKSVLIQGAMVESLRESRNLINVNCAMSLEFDEGGAYRDLNQYELAYVGREALGVNFLLYARGSALPRYDSEVYNNKYMIPEDDAECIQNFKFHSNIAELSNYDIYFRPSKHQYRLVELQN
jgi:hypothetical protein